MVSQPPQFSLFSERCKIDDAKKCKHGTLEHQVPVREIFVATKHLVLGVSLRNVQVHFGVIYTKCVQGKAKRVECLDRQRRHGGITLADADGATEMLRKPFDL